MRKALGNIERGAFGLPGLAQHNHKLQTLFDRPALTGVPCKRDPLHKIRVKRVDYPVNVTLRFLLEEHGIAYVEKGCRGRVVPVEVRDIDAQAGTVSHY